MKTSIHRCTSLLFLAITLPNVALAADKPEAPYVNPNLAASSYPIFHSTGDFSRLAGPVGPTRRLRADETQWKTIGQINGYFPVYSGPYPNGKRVIWVGGVDRIQKLDADTLDVLATYAIGGTYLGDEEIKHHVATMDKLDAKGLADYNIKLWAEPIKNIQSCYHLLSKDNELYIPHRGSDGSLSLRVYGDADATDPASKIVLRREWKIPAEISKAALIGVTVTSDGWLILVTQDGSMIALSRDFTVYHSVKLPSKHEEGPNQDFFSGFVRNSLVSDDQGGIYVVTRDNMHRVQWTGSKLSLDEADGAWSAPYPNELVRGSGTTPALMGWGPKEDHLVVIADGSRGNKAIVFWRDAIPSDWKGLPGFDRRVAGITPIHFGVSKDEHPELENAAVVYGYGAFFNATYPEHSVPEYQNVPSKRWLADSAYMNLPGHEARGGALIRWDPKERVLKQAWQTQTNFLSTVCSVSGATEMVYCWGARDKEYTLEGTDWNTGKSAFHYILGKSRRFDPTGAPMIIARDGQIECGCAGGLGLIRVNPKQGAKQRQKIIK